ncbi:hypothetical protein [Mesorhizobium sp. Cs1299R1N3]|uniref:hypothetical protein n=1 Tax=Mesorhizobium sp. Cs1299R1N3 TaxID=3015173 RepID=UPI00301D3E10
MKNYIKEAAAKAEKLVNIIDALEACGKENAMRALSNRHRLPYQLIWNLRFRPPKSIAYDLVMMLDEVYRKKCREAGAALMVEAEAALNEEGLNASDRNIVLAGRSVGRQAEGATEASFGRRAGDIAAA